MSQANPTDVAAIQIEANPIGTEMKEIRAERERLLEQQKRIMELIGSSDPAQLIHDIRNVLNERALLRTLAESIL